MKFPLLACTKKLIQITILIVPTCFAFHLSLPSLKHSNLQRLDLLNFHVSTKHRVSPAVTLRKKDKKRVIPFCTFYNREAEIKVLTRLLNRKPVFTVLVGPPSCGKSALINHVLDQMLDDTDVFHSIRIDLRGRDVSDRYALLSALKQKSGISASLDKMWSAFSDALQSVEINNPAGLNVKLRPPVRKPEFNLDEIISTIPRWPNNGDGRPFVLFIDEANELSALARADEQACNYLDIILSCGFR
jgi:hypothetical protein